MLTLDTHYYSAIQDTVIDHGRLIRQMTWPVRLILCPRQPKDWRGRSFTFC